jgi:DNA modification methylase
LHGDCLSVLPTIPSGTVDAVIADPPYSSGGMTAGTRQVIRSRNTSRTSVLEGCGYIGIEMDPVYAEIARKRIGGVSRNEEAVAGEPNHATHPEPFRP